MLRREFQTSRESSKKRFLVQFLQHAAQRTFHIATHRTAQFGHDCIRFSPALPELREHGLGLRGEVDKAFARVVMSRYGSCQIVLDHLGDGLAGGRVGKRGFRRDASDGCRTMIRNEANDRCESRTVVQLERSIDVEHILIQQVEKVLQKGPQGRQRSRHGQIVTVLL